MFCCKLPLNSVEFTGVVCKLTHHNGNACNQVVELRHRFFLFRGSSFFVLSSHCHVGKGLKMRTLFSLSYR